MKLVLTLGLLLCVHGAYAADARVTAVLADVQNGMSDIKTLETSFVQKKHLAMFSNDLMITGKVFISKPSLLAWHVDSPVVSRMYIDGDIIKQWDADSGKVATVDMSKNVGFKIAIDQMQRWFSGAYASFAGEYAISIVSETPLVLSFVPNADNPSAAFISSVNVTFRDDRKYLAILAISEKSGDTTEMVFSDTHINEDISSKIKQLR
jgi:outer membrane lipoprotein-sorting protein